jgi:hypothetical protein
MESAATLKREPQPGDFEIAIMDNTGDTKYMFNPNNTTEVEIAREVFKKYRKEGYICFSANDDGSKNEQLNEFDPKVAKMIFSPPLVGG